MIVQMLVGLWMLAVLYMLARNAMNQREMNMQGYRNTRALIDAIHQANRKDRL